MVLYPKISVIIPVFNAALTIEQCIKSILTCNYHNLEVIVVDDASTDDSASIIARLPCLLVRLTSQSGPGNARNEGVKHASGEILAFTDADCEVPHDWLYKIAATFQDTDLGGVTGGYKGNLDKGLIAAFQFHSACFRQLYIPQYINSCTTSNFACKKSLFESIGGFPQKYVCEDMQFGLTLSAHSKILWDRTNSVFHHFEKRMRAYFIKQISWAEATATILLGTPLSIRKQYTWRNHDILAQLFFTILMWASLVVAAWYPSSLAVFFGLALLCILLNIKFIIFVARRENMFRALIMLPLLFVRNTAWLTGIVKAVFSMF